MTLNSFENMPNETREMKLFMSFVLPSQRNIYAYILSMVIHPCDADDILQDTLALMWEKFNEFEHGSDFAAWGKTIARYKVLNHLKKNKSAKVRFDDDVLKIIESESGQMNYLSDRLTAMQRCLKKLSEKDRNLLRMRYYDDFSFKKIALKIGISKQSAYRSISRIHCKLVKCIKQVLAPKEVYDF